MQLSNQLNHTSIYTELEKFSDKEKNMEIK